MGGLPALVAAVADERRMVPAGIVVRVKDASKYPTIQILPRIRANPLSSFSDNTALNVHRT